MLLQCLPVLLIGRIFNGDGVVTFADFTTFLALALVLFSNIYKSRRRRRIGDKLRNVILQQTTWVSVTSSRQSVLKDRGHRLLTLFGGQAAEYSGTGHGVYGSISLNILPSLSTMSSSLTSLPGILDVSSVARILVPEGVVCHQRLHPPFHEGEGHVFGPQPGFSQALIFCSSLGRLIPSCIVGSVFHHGQCFGCCPLGFSSSGWWLVT
jgi:hypothetical protein